MNVSLSIFSIAIIFLYACSPAKQIERSARKNVLTDPALHTAHVGISVYDPSEGKYLYNYQGDKYFVPASNTKIPTCYAAMKYLGDSLVGLRYELGVNVIHLKPSGDPTFLHPDFKEQPVFVFLKNYNAILLQNRLFTGFLGSGWSWNDYQQSYMAQRSDFPVYGNLVRFKWINKNLVEVAPKYFGKETKSDPTKELNDGFEISKDWDANSFFLMNGKTRTTEVPYKPDIKTIMELLRDTLNTQVEFDWQVPTNTGSKLYSRPTDSLLKPMMHNSDNFFAEQSLLMVSNEMFGVMNDRIIIDSLLKTDFKDLPQKPRWADGSGLSRFNLFTPQDFVAILNKMKNEFGMERIKTIFPTGNEGTLEDLYKSEVGFIYAKTGTLSGVLALSGFLYTKKNKMLIFSILINNHQASATLVRRAMEKFVRELREKN